MLSTLCIDAVKHITSDGFPRVHQCQNDDAVMCYCYRCKNDCKCQVSAAAAENIIDSKIKMHQWCLSHVFVQTTVCYNAKALFLLETLHNTFDELAATHIFKHS